MCLHQAKTGLSRFAFCFSELVEGSVAANLLVEGSTVTLLPRAETGLLVSIQRQSSLLFFIDNNLVWPHDKRSSTLDYIVMIEA